MTLIDMMMTMQALQLFDEGEYMVIYVDMMTYSVREAQKYLWSEPFFFFFVGIVIAGIDLLARSFINLLIFFSFLARFDFRFRTRSI